MKNLSTKFLNQFLNYENRRDPDCLEADQPLPPPLDMSLFFVANSANNKETIFLDKIDDYIDFYKETVWYVKRYFEIINNIEKNARK